MMLCLMQRRPNRIANVLRSCSPAIKLRNGKSVLRKQYFGSQSIPELDRDSYIFGEPTETSRDGETRVYKTFVDMSVSKQLAVALQNTDKSIPTTIQKASFDSIQSKKDVIICAETGSGKTLAYLLPILQQYYKKADEQTGRNSVDSEGMGYKYPSTIIMVPNKELMAQVYNMSQEILFHANTAHQTGEDGNIPSIVVSSGCVERVDGHWPYRGIKDEPLSHCPDILICTPAFLSAFIKGPKIIEEEFFYAIKRCILDEADMLLEGSYKKDVEKIFDVFKILRRRIMKQHNMQPHERVVQFILSAATISTHGKHSVDQYLQKRFPRAERLTSASFHKHHPRIEQDFLHVDFMQQSGKDKRNEGHERERWSEGGNEVDGDESTVSVMTPARVELVFRALIGALPPREEEESNGDGSAGDWHPNQWKEDRSFSVEDIPPTMIFTNTAGKARDLAAALMEYEDGVLADAVTEFHKLVPTYEKQDALEKFRQHDTSGVKILVCTDAAARGLDLPSVEHVIQAEFALNVVQHMHRNGRASRAGKKGRATIIFDDGAIDLVQSILAGSASDEGDDRSIDSSFSRRRGFRRNVNRRLKRRQQSEHRR